MVNMMNKLKNQYYKIIRIKHRYFNPFNIMTSIETLDKIMKTKCSMCRYGDGELLMLTEDYSITFQKYDPQLAERLRGILKSDDDKIIVCLPYMLKSLNNLHHKDYWYWEDRLFENRRKIYKLTQKGKLYGDTQCTRPYIIKIDKSDTEEIFYRVKQLCDNQDLLIVEGEHTCLGVGNDLLSKSKSIERILAPAANAFDYYDRILEETSKRAENKLVLIALGPTATVLAYDLAKLGFWALDVGHIDIEYEWFLCGTDKKIPIKAKHVNEVLEGRNPEENTNEKYLSEIVFRI